MTNRLQAIIPAAFQPIDPAPLPPAETAGGRAERLTAFAAIALAVLLVALIAMLMGMT